MSLRFRIWMSATSGSSKRISRSMETNRRERRLFKATALAAIRMSPSDDEPFRVCQGSPNPPSPLPLFILSPTHRVSPDAYRRVHTAPPRSRPFRVVSRQCLSLVEPGSLVERCGMAPQWLLHRANELSRVAPPPPICFSIL